MNKTIQYLFLGYLLLITSIIYAQSDSPFDKYTYISQGKIYPNEGEPITRKLGYSFLAKNLYVFREDGKREKLKPKEIKGFTLDTLGVMDFVVKQGAIYQNITPNDGKEVRLYKKFISQGLVTYAIEDEVQGDWQYFLDFPDKKNVLSIDDIRVSIHKTLPRYLGACPELAKKVSQRQEGYKYEGNPLKVKKVMKQALLNSEKDAPENPKAGLYLKILREYYNCK